METALIISGICACSCSANPGTRSRRAASDFCRCAELSHSSNPVYIVVLSAARSSSNHLRVTGHEPARQGGYSGRSGCLRQSPYLVLDCLCGWSHLQYDHQYNGRAHDPAATAILKMDRAKTLDTSPPAPLPGAKRGAKVLYWLLAACAAMIATLILYFFAPDQHAFYPRCLFHAVTGLQCPGCGGLRAAHCLLHGDLAGAWRFNPLLIIAIPLVGVWSIGYLLHQRSGRSRTRFFQESTCGWGIAAMAILFAIARNWPK